MSTLLGGALVPHAPQFFSLPDTEDKSTVERVRTALGEVGKRLAALKPDVWIVIANDHANQFLLHCTPPFCFHLGAEVKGSFVGRDFRYRVASDAAMKLMQHVQSEGFDPAFTNNAGIDYAFGIPLTFLGVDAPIIPLYVNSYIPPQPSMRRCYDFGEAIARGLHAKNIKAVVIASGGMSHFPGTDRYSNPDLAFDNSVLDKLREGKLKSLIGYHEKELDDTGNIELRCWAMAAGALGDRTPDVCRMNPSWHHNYASLGFYSAPADAATPHYPQIKPDLVGLTSAFHALAHDSDAQAAFMQDAQAFADRYQLTPVQRETLIKLDMASAAAMGMHPLVPFLANMQIERKRKAAGPK
jgi:2,3-dihydroxyphenylpropionate 1,2-dioxygenase